MKTKYIIYLLLFSIIGYGQTEKKSIFISYSFTYQIDSTDVSSVFEEKMNLIISRNKSLFLSKGVLLGDSLNKINSQEKKIKAIKKISKSKIKSRIYKYKDLNKITFTGRVVKDNYIYTEKLNLFKWHLLDSTKTIGGYECNQAKASYGGRTYIAWYSKAIPISEGPYKFNGLPGLIIKIQDVKKQITYQMTALKNIPYIDMEQPKDYIEVSKCQFLKLRKEKYGNIRASIKQAGIHIGFSESKWRELQKSYDKKNNFIELNCK